MSNMQTVGKAIALVITTLAIAACQGESEKTAQNNHKATARQERLAAMAGSVKTPIEIAPGTVLRSVKAMDGNILQFDYDMSSTPSELKKRLDAHKSELIKAACQRGHPVKDMGAKAKYVWSIDGKQAMTLEIDESMCQPYQAATAAKEAK